MTACRSDTQLALNELLEGRQYQQLFAWPEQGLEVYLVGLITRRRPDVADRKVVSARPGRLLAACAPSPASIVNQPNRGPHNRSGMETPSGSLARFSTCATSRPQVLRPVLEAEGELWAAAPSLGLSGLGAVCSCNILTTICCPATQRFHRAASWAMYFAFTRRQRLSLVMSSRCHRIAANRRQRINHRRNIAPSSLALLLNSPHVERIEAQLLLHPSETLGIFRGGWIRNLPPAISGTDFSRSTPSPFSRSAAEPRVPPVARSGSRAGRAAHLRSVSRSSRQPDQRPVPLRSRLHAFLEQHRALCRLRHFFSSGRRT